MESRSGATAAMVSIYSLRNKEYMKDLTESLVEKSESGEVDFENIYKDPSSYVRPFDQEQFTKTYSHNTYPAHIAIPNESALPARFKDAGIVSVTLPVSQFNHFYDEEPKLVNSQCEREYKHWFKVAKSKKFSKK